MGRRRSPDAFRPAHVPEGEPFANVGRPSFAAGVVAVVIVVSVGLIVYALID